MLVFGHGADWKLVKQKRIFHWKCSATNSLVGRNSPLLRFTVDTMQKVASLSYKGRTSRVCQFVK